MKVFLVSLEKIKRDFDMRFNDNSIKRKNNVSVLGDKGVVLTEKYQIPYVGTNNMNTIIISSVGTGKTRGFLKSNLLQKGCSFVVTDTKGDLFNEFAGYLKSNACGSDSYDIKLVNLKNPQWSNNYNPFRYMHTEEDVVSFATALSVNVTKNPDDSFWLNITTNLIASMCFFVFETYDAQDRNIGSLIEIFNQYMKKSDNSDSGYIKNPASCYYKEIMDLLPETSKAKRFFLKCDCSGRTWESAMATVGQALAVFEFSKLLDMVKDDDLELERIGQRKTALFINLDDTNPCYDFIAGLLYTQIFQVLYKQADKNWNCQLEEHVRFFMDDFANYRIPNISHVLSTCRSRGISLEMLLQSESQLQALYGQEAENLIANSAYVYIGSNDLQTQQNIAQRLGCSIQEIQQSINKTYVFFPEGKTLCDTKADYLKHSLFSILKSQKKIKESDIGSGDINHFDLWSYEYYEKNLEYHSVRDIVGFTDEQELNLIRPRINKYDSDEERMFHEELLDNEEVKSQELNILVHQDIREIFDLKYLTNKPIRYKLMLMHCDFIVKKGNDVIAAIEIDGSQHQTDMKQERNDKIKNKLFEQNKIPLYRIKALDIRMHLKETCDNLVAQILQEEKQEIGTSMTSETFQPLLVTKDEFFF